MFGVYEYDIVVPTTLVGVCGLTSIDLRHRTAEFSVLIHPEHQRKGYGEDALSCLLHYGFDHLNLHRIWGETFEGNPGMRLYDKLGFKLEGRAREAYYKEGAYHDALVYGMLQHEWKR